jgi:hypothetical protein
LQGAAADSAINPATIADTDILEWYVDCATRFRQSIDDAKSQHR